MTTTPYTPAQRATAPLIRVEHPLDVVFAPDSYKGSLTSVEVARALAAGWRRARPGDQIELAPLADGGEGTLVAIEAAGGWKRRTTTVRGPDFEPVKARWLISPDGDSAVIEMAAASGLSLIPPQRRRTTDFTSLGTGELIRAALDAGVRRITLGIGGSATTDGGAGILVALGARISFDDRMRVAAWEQGSGQAAPPAIMLGRTKSIDLADLDPRLAEVDLQIACDVTNPLLGGNGAAAVYGPQKGARPDEVEELDAALGVYADALEAATGQRARDTPGAGAAGGVGFGLLCLEDHLSSLELVPGVDVVMAAADLPGKLARADLVLTGEGQIDAQTAFGKTALGVARAAKAAGVPCIAVGGGVERGGIEALAGLAVVIPVVERPMTVEDAMRAGVEPLERCGERIARLVTLLPREPKR